jgi:hypothetical protein
MAECTGKKKKKLDLQNLKVGVFEAIYRGRESEKGKKLNLIKTAYWYVPEETRGLSLLFLASSWSRLCIGGSRSPILRLLFPSSDKDKVFFVTTSLVEKVGGGGRGGGGATWIRY